MKTVEPIRDKKKIEAIKKYLRGSSLRDYCMLVVGINIPLRASDLLKLKIKDVLDGPGQVKEKIHMREMKTGKTQDYPISKSAAKAIKEYLQTRMYLPDSPLFISRKHGKHLKRHQAWAIIKNAAASVGIKDNIGFHTLRKTFGYHAYQSGISVEHLQLIFKHSSPNITLRYIGITKDELDDIMISVDL